MDNSKTNQITEGVIYKQLLLFFLPILIGSAFQQLYNTVDTMIVGHFVGTHALAAVGAPATLLNLLLNFFVGLAGGASVIIAQYYGAKDNQGVSLAVHTSTALCIIFGLALTIFGELFAIQLLEMIAIPNEIFQDTLIYTRIFFLGMIPSIFYNVGSGILRAIGDSKTPLYYLIISTIANIILDIVFVVMFHLDVMGVAIATIMCQTLSALLVARTLIKTNESYHLNIANISFHKNTLQKIMKIGLPAGLQSVMYSISNLIIQTSINLLGTNAIAAWNVSGKIDSLFWMMINAFGVSITTFVGQNYGAKKYDRIKKSVNICYFMCAIGSIVMTYVFMKFGTQICYLFTDDAVVIDLSMVIIRAMAPYYITFVGIEVYSGAIRGAGEALKPMLLTAFGVCGLRILWMLIVVPTNLTIKTICLCYPISWIITCILFTIYYYRGHWLKTN